MSFEVNANRDGLDALIAQVEKAQRKALREMGRGEWGGLHMFSAKIRPNATALTRVVPEVAAG